MNITEAKTQSQVRQSKYCTAILAEITRLGHATNAELLSAMRHYYPNVSATTVHRATTRLASRGEIGFAPSDTSGAMRYDAQVTPHDHFQCTQCGRLRDIDIVEHIRPMLQAAASDCIPTGRLTISGSCKKCKGGKV